jgi:hypothetical protein
MGSEGRLLYSLTAEIAWTDGNAAAFSDEKEELMRAHFRGPMLVALMLVLCVPGRAAAKWTRLQTENFLFVGDAPERQIRQIAQRLEQFREVMSRILPAAAVSASTPTIVFVFQTDQSLTPYKPRFEGRPVEVAGYFLARRDANYVAINAGSEQAALRIIS